MPILYKVTGTTLIPICLFVIVMSAKTTSGFVLMEWCIFYSFLEVRNHCTSTQSALGRVKEYNPLPQLSSHAEIWLTESGEFFLSGR